MASVKRLEASTALSLQLFRPALWRNIAALTVHILKAEVGTAKVICYVAPALSRGPPFVHPRFAALVVASDPA